MMAFLAGAWIDPSLERRVILGISANDVRPLVKWERFIPWALLR